MKGRIIAINANAEYLGISLRFDRRDVPNILDRNYAVGNAAQFLIAGGDLMGLTPEAAIRALRATPPRRFRGISEILAFAEAEGIGHISIRDKNGNVMNEIGEWNMTCEDDKEVFVENISKNRSWHHLMTGHMIYETAIAA